MKTIKWYRKTNYGTTHEYIHPDNAGEAQIVQQLTGKKTIDGRVRELLRDFFGGSNLVWQEVVAP